MNELRILVPANFRENTRRFRIDQKGLIALRLAKIDIRKCGGIDKNIEILRAQFLAHFIKIRQINVCAINTSDIESFPIFAHERRAETVSRAYDYDFHVASEQRSMGFQLM